MSEANDREWVVNGLRWFVKGANDCEWCVLRVYHVQLTIFSY